VSRLLERLRQSRLPGELWFLLGGAATGAVAGALLAALLPPAPVPRFPSAPVWFGAFLVAARGFFVGWWVGLGWSVLLVVAARRPRPPLAVGALLPATVLAAAALLVVTAGGVLAGAVPAVAAAAGALAALLAAALRVRRGGSRTPR